MERVIIDCDPGHDDAIALLLALSSPELEVAAVTTVAGNTTLDKTTSNAIRVLDLAGRSDIPVAAGAVGPLRRELVVAEHVHGASGLDGPVLEPPSRKPHAAHAVEVMAAALVEAPATLVPVGPLTNVAMLLERHPEAAARIDRIVLMGGAMGLGNITPAAEFNIWVDPEAAAAVFASGLDITMVGLDVTHRALLHPSHGDELRGTGGRVGGFVADLLEFFMQRYERVFGTAMAPIHDAAAVAYLVDPTLISTEWVNVEVETQSELTRGNTVVDRFRVTGRHPNAAVAVDVDSERFAAVLVERLSGLDA